MRSDPLGPAPLDDSRCQLRMRVWHFSRTCSPVVPSGTCKHRGRVRRCGLAVRSSDSCWRSPWKAG
eukprot:365070-Chlamydomonas_euryale.AAC.1